MSFKKPLFVELLKKHTSIDPNFIDKFFTRFTPSEELDFHIKDTDAADYLNLQLKTLRKRLLNKYSKAIMFMERVDYIKINTGNKREVTYMLNYQCFERLAMNGNTQEAETVRMYFVKLREFLTENRMTIFQAMENNEDLKKYQGLECIYFFALDERKQEIFKIGRTIDVLKRLRNYNVGRIKEVELKYLAVVSDAKLIEKCMKENLQQYQYLENHEVYKVKPEVIKRIVNKCYCKHTTKAEHNALYEQLGHLLGLYAYTKGKKNIHPFVVIDKKSIQ
jgi:hypothetical protein